MVGEVFFFGCVLTALTYTLACMILDIADWYGWGFVFLRVAMLIMGGAIPAAVTAWWLQ